MPAEIYLYPLDDPDRGVLVFYLEKAKDFLISNIVSSELGNAIILRSNERQTAVCPAEVTKRQNELVSFKLNGKAVLLTKPSEIYKRTIYKNDEEDNASLLLIRNIGALPMRNIEIKPHHAYSRKSTYGKATWQNNQLQHSLDYPFHLQ